MPRRHKLNSQPVPPIKLRMPTFTHVMRYELPHYRHVLLFDRFSQVLFHDEGYRHSDLEGQDIIEYDAGPRMVLPAERWSRSGVPLPDLFLTRHDESVFDPDHEDEVPLALVDDLRSYHNQGTAPSLRPLQNGLTAHRSCQSDAYGCDRPPGVTAQSCELPCYCSPGVGEDRGVSTPGPDTECIQGVDVSEVALRIKWSYYFARYDKDFEGFEGVYIDYSQYQPGDDHELESGSASLKSSKIPSVSPTPLPYEVATRETHTKSTVNPLNHVHTHASIARIQVHDRLYSC